MFSHRSLLPPCTEGAAGRFTIAPIRILRAHPWTLEVVVGVRVIGPNEPDWAEAGLRILAGTTLDRAERFDALALVIGHVRGIVAQGVDDNPEHAVALAMAEIVKAHVDRYPQTRAAFDAARTGGGQDNALAFGLARICDGLDAAMSGRAGACPAVRSHASRTRFAKPST